jgi:AAA+ superfamily predicted ATPase
MPLLIGEPYADAQDHLRDLFRRLELQIERLERARNQDSAGVAALDENLQALDDTIASREHASEAADITLPLLRLRDTLSLGPYAEQALLALAGSELDPRILTRLVRFWADARHGDVAFYRDLVGRDLPGGREVGLELSPAGTLARHGLIILGTDKMWGPSTPLLFSRVRLGPRVSSYLAGEVLPSARSLPPAIQVRVSGRPLDRMVVPTGVIERLVATLRSAERTRRLVCLCGPRHLGKKSLAQAVLQRPLVLFDCARLGTDVSEGGAWLRDALCEAALQNGALYLDHTEALVGDNRAALRQAVGEQLGGLLLPVLAGFDGAGDALIGVLPDVELFQVPLLDSLEQSTLWSLLLPDRVQLQPGHGVDWMAAHYSLPAGAIQRCVDDIVRIADARGQVVVDHNDAVAAVRRQLGSRFGDLAELLVNTFSWDDLVLQPDTLQRVLEIVMYFKHRDRLLREWGFESKLPYGKSLSVLLSGDPGTGKTMVAGLLAKEMGLELFRVNISKVVDKYIGETEKNLGRIFEEAKRGQVALLFDEADSLFGKRTEVRNSTDRYSNLAINFLLQSVELHDGVIILTTNHEKAMDPAFKRRIRFRVSFPFPDLDERTALWKSMVPARASIDPGIRWAELAREFDLAGGSIKNAVVRAALHAVEKGSPITEELLRHTGRLESEEMGRLVRSSAPIARDDEEAAHDSDD